MSPKQRSIPGLAEHTEQREQNLLFWLCLQLKVSANFHWMQWLCVISLEGDLDEALGIYMDVVHQQSILPLCCWKLDYSINFNSSEVVDNLR